MRVSNHAASRYCERMKVLSMAAARASIVELLADAEELELKSRWKNRQFINHGAHASYFRAIGLVFVVVNDTVVSVHRGKAKRWKSKSK